MNMMMIEKKEKKINEKNHQKHTENDTAGIFSLVIMIMPTII